MIWIRALLVLCGLSLIVISFFFVRLIRRARGTGAWMNQNLRVYLFARAISYLVIAALFIVASLWRRGEVLYAAAAVLFGNYAVGWWAQRRNGQPLTLRGMKRRP